MKTGRLEAFSDGVIAIIITIMVLEIKAPESTDIQSLLPIMPVFLSYVLSFIYVAIYWINHHYILQLAEKVNTTILWANLFLLFWLSLIPFTTSWLGENHLESVPVAIYGGSLLMCSIAYWILEIKIAKYNDTPALRALYSRRKECISVAVYSASIPLAFLNIFLSIACYILIAAWWIIPSKKRSTNASA